MSSFCCGSCPPPLVDSVYVYSRKYTSSLEYDSRRLARQRWTARRSPVCKWDVPVDGTPERQTGESPYQTRAFAGLLSSAVGRFSCSCPNASSSTGPSLSPNASPGPPRHKPEPKLSPKPAFSQRSTAECSAGAAGWVWCEKTRCVGGLADGRLAAG